MNAESNKPESHEAAVSRAIDKVLAAERNAEIAIADATAAANKLRQQATEDSHRITARAEARIGAIHRSVAADSQAKIERLRQSSAADDQDTPLPDIDSQQMRELAVALAQWLTTDDDE